MFRGIGGITNPSIEVEVAARGHLLILALCADFEAICRILMRIQIDVRWRIHSMIGINRIVIVQNVLTIQSIRGG